MSLRRVADGDRSLYFSVIAGAAVAAFVATFLISYASIEFETKTQAFSALIAAFLIVSSLAYWRLSPRGPAKTDDDKLQDTLRLLDEAEHLFAGKLDSADAFRLAASRISDLLSYRTATLFLLDETRTRLVQRVSVGAEADAGQEQAIQGIAQRALESNSPRMADVQSERSVALPLAREGNVFGVIHFLLDPNFDPATTIATTLEALAERVAPLILAGRSLEHSRSHALTDVTTDLPNERAFRLVLGDQIAEAHRSRPLAILAIDVLRFNEINSRFSHAAGDKVLNFVAQVSCENLREMDFFARGHDDEFLAILPTATASIAQELVARLNTALKERSVEVANSLFLEVELAFGWASVGEDGETAESLLAAARTRRDQSKYSLPHKVLWFPSETAN